MPTLTDLETKLLGLLRGPRTSDRKIREAMRLDQGALLRMSAEIRRKFTLPDGASLRGTPANIVAVGPNGEEL